MENNKKENLKIKIEEFIIEKVYSNEGCQWI